MFGLFELQLPARCRSGSPSAATAAAGTFLGTFVMGALSALIVDACVAPPLVGALPSSARRGEVALGGSALFAMALGMGVPLLLVGASAGVLLPQGRTLDGHGQDSFSA